MVQEKQTIENHNPVLRLGEYGVSGGPGRPKGLRNRFNLIKQEMLEVWEEENGKERFRSLLTGPKADFLKALDKIVALLPKDFVVNDAESEPKQELIIRWATDEEVK